MVGHFWNLILLAAVLIVFAAGWGIATLAVYRDVRRRELAWPDRLFWLAVALILPGIGALVYTGAQWSAQWAFPVAPPSRTPPHRPAFRSPVAKIPAGSAQAPRGYRLVEIGGDEAGREYPLDRLPVEIGGPELVAPLAEPFHDDPPKVILYFATGNWWIRCPAGRSGVWVNDAAVQAQVLHPGDRIRVGDAELVLQAPAGREP